MDIEKMFIVLLLLVFTALLFPSMNNAVIAIDPSEPLRPLLMILPTMLLLIEITGFAYEVITT